MIGGYCCTSQLTLGSWRLLPKSESSFLQFDLLRTQSVQFKATRMMRELTSRSAVLEFRKSFHDTHAFWFRHGVPFSLSITTLPWYFLAPPSLHLPPQKHNQLKTEHKPLPANYKNLCQWGIPRLNKISKTMNIRTTTEKFTLEERTQPRPHHYSAAPLRDYRTKKRRTIDLTP